MYRRQATLLKKARKAALQADSAGTAQALIAWGQLQWPDDAPRSIGVIAERVSSPLADELRALSRLSYGPEAATWDGAALGEGIAFVRRRRRSRRTRQRVTAAVVTAYQCPQLA